MWLSPPWPTYQMAKPSQLPIPKSELGRRRSEGASVQHRAAGIEAKQRPSRHLSKRQRRFSPDHERLTEETSLLGSDLTAELSDLGLLVDPSRQDSASDVDGNAGIVVRVRESRVGFDGRITGSLPSHETPNGLAILFGDQDDSAILQDGVHYRLNERLDGFRVSFSVNVLEPTEVLVGLVVDLGDSCTVGGGGRADSCVHVDVLFGEVRRR